MTLELWFRSLHMLFAVLWVGGAIYRSTVVETTLRSDSGFAERFFAQAFHGPYMGLTAIGTVGFGVARMVMAPEGAYTAAVLGDGLFLFHGAVLLGNLALLVGLLGHLPTDVKLKPIARARLAGKAHDEKRYHALVRREALLGRVSLVLIAGAAFGMTTFRAF